MANRAQQLNALAQSNYTNKIQKWFDSYYESLMQCIERAVRENDQLIYVITRGTIFDVVLHNEHKRDLLTSKLEKEGFSVHYCLGKYFSDQEEPCYTISWYTPMETSELLLTYEEN